MVRLVLLWFLWFAFVSRAARVAKAARVGNPRKNATENCASWNGGSACAKCEAEQANIVGALVYKAKCIACPEGHILQVSGDDILHDVAFDMTLWHNIDVFWMSRCVPLVGEERRLIMIRHGESLWNELMERTSKAAGIVGAWVGEDSPLSPLGLRQAQRLANVLKKAGKQVYPRSRPPESIEDESDLLLLEAARSELTLTDLENALTIKDTASKRVITDEDMVNNLVREQNREELDVLLGRKCSDTNFVSSQLARAMDTLVIATMESRLQCAAPWIISSNLQEIEHNLDCSPKARPKSRPEMAGKQKKAYYMNGIGRTQEYVEARYDQSDVSRYNKNFQQLERARWKDQSPQMHDELDVMFASPKKFNVWGGHSIWFRHFFQEFADEASPVCKELQDIKMANTAMVSLRLRRIDPAFGDGYAAYDCKWLHLGPSDHFELKLDNDILPRLMIPEARDFDNGVEQIMGWKCCCSRSAHKDAVIWSLRKRKSLEKCVLVHTDHCSSPSTWSDVWRHDAPFIQDARNYDWGHNKGPCVL